MNIFQILFWISLAAILYIYFLYPFVLSFLSLFTRQTARKDNEEEEYTPYVSIVMAAYNEEVHVERKIKNCLSLDYPENKLEIIIGSDGSDDRTNEIVRKYAGKRLLFFPHSARRGKMVVINDGVNHAKGEICVFSDVSEVFDADAVKKLVRNFVDPSIGAVTGNHVYNPSTSGLGKGTHLYWRYQRWLQRTESRLATILACDGTIYACRRDLFIPPPPGTINDDKAVPMGIVQQGYRVIFEPKAIARGDVLPETKSFFGQKVRGQAGMYQLFWLFRNMFWPRKPLVWLIFISHSVGPVLVPWLLLLLLFSNVGLYNTFPYNWALFFHVVFYCSSVMGIITEHLKLHLPGFHIPYFFVLSNVASIVSFWSFLFKVQKATWTKVE